MEGLRVMINRFPQNKKKCRKITEKYLEEEIQIGTIQQVCVRSQKKDKYQIQFTISNWNEKSKHARTVKYALTNGNKFRLVLSGVSCYIEPNLLQRKKSSNTQKTKKKSAVREISMFRDKKRCESFHNDSVDTEIEVLRKVDLWVQYSNDFQIDYYYYYNNKYDEYDNYDYYDYYDDYYDYYHDVDPNRVDKNGYLMYY